MSVMLIVTGSMFMSFLLPVMAQPLSLGLVILCMTVSASCMCGVFVSSYYGYILFLIYVGGLLVMFTYVAALIPNVKYKFNLSIMGVLLGMMIGLVHFLYQDYTFMDSYSLGSGYHVLMKNTGWVIMTKFGIVMALVMVLLLVLIVVVKVCYGQGAALRSFS
uniref:NADH dehydrogenase subunit 6 n=1 Tax=Dendropoma nebulosum TaxID=170983 RepID=A0A075QQZ0_9CAEN|nr:NADH dehydrogenase subunit 6 [Dendropoma nebulosum]